MDTRIRMKAWREALGLSKQQFARALDVYPSLVTMWEHRNYSHGPSEKNIEKLCEVAKISLQRFYFGRLPKRKRARA